MNFIFEDGSRNLKNFDVKCSIYEIYNETFYDLLNKRGPKKKNNITDIAEVQIKSIDEFIQMFKLANNHRRTASTRRNQYSSRSHSVVKISMEGLARETNENLSSNIHMLDCAGQESLNDLLKNEKNQIRRYEMSTINKAYSGLASVIQCLKKDDEYVNFRHSKLTFVLKPYLTGNARTLIIATTSQEKKYMATSKSIYKVINRANMIKCKYKKLKITNK